MKKENERALQLYAALGMMVLGAGLVVADFIILPLGDIHQSTQVIFGEMLAFVGAIFGIDYKYKFERDKKE